MKRVEGRIRHLLPGKKGKDTGDWALRSHHRMSSEALIMRAKAGGWPNCQVGTGDGEPLTLKGELKLYAQEGTRRLNLL